MKIRNALFLYFFLMAAFGCATVKSAGPPAGIALIDCSLPDIQAGVGDILNDVRLILTGGAVDWQAELDEYAGKGKAVLACAVARVGMSLATGSSNPVMASAVAGPSDKASSYLMSRHLQPTNVQR